MVELSEETRTVETGGRRNPIRALAIALISSRLMWSHCSQGSHFHWSMPPSRCAPHPKGHTSVNKWWEKLVNVSEVPMEVSLTSHHLASCCTYSSTGTLVFGGSQNWFQWWKRFHCRGWVWKPPNGIGPGGSQWLTATWEQWGRMLQQKSNYLGGICRELSSEEVFSLMLVHIDIWDRTRRPGIFCVLAKDEGNTKENTDVTSCWKYTDLYFVRHWCVSGTEEKPTLIMIKMEVSCQPTYT